MNIMERILSFVFRLKLSKHETLAIVQNAADAKGWKLSRIVRPERYMWYWHGGAHIDGKDRMAIWMVDGRTGEVLQLDEVKMDDPPATHS